MPAFNREYYLPDAIESILNQTFSDFELIIVDDGSTDKTPEIIRHYEAQDPRVRSIRQKNGGAPKARNAGIAEAKGEFIIFMDDDDISAPERLEKQYRFLQDHPHLSSVNCWKTTMTESGEIIRKNPDIRMFASHEQEIMPDVATYLHGRGRNFTMGAPTMVRTESIRAIGGFRELFVSGEDTDATLRFEEKFAMGAIPDALYIVRSREADGRISQGIYTWKRLAAAITSAHYRRTTGKDPLDGTHTIENITKLFSGLPETIKKRLTDKLIQGWKRKIYQAIKSNNMEMLEEIFSWINKTITDGDIPLDKSHYRRIRKIMLKAAMRALIQARLRLFLKTVIFATSI